MIRVYQYRYWANMDVDWMLGFGITKHRMIIALPSWPRLISIEYMDIEDKMDIGNNGYNSTYYCTKL